MTGKQYQVIVIGAGASGMTAAITALEEVHNGDTQKQGRVLLLECNDRAGKKLLATGNGKCNFTHENISIEHYHTDDRAVLGSVLSDFPTEAALDFFGRLGMPAREKNGYYYPSTETASTVLDVLRLRLSELGADLMCGIHIDKIQKRRDGFGISFQEQGTPRQASGRSIILASGSKAGGFLQDKQEDPLRPAKLLGLHSTALYPSLTKCICREDHYYRQLAGVRTQVRLSLYAKDERRSAGYAESRNHGKNGWDFLREESGELQLTKEGISGIPVFQLSGDIAQNLAEKKRVIVEINFLPDFQENELEEWIKRRLSLLPGRSLEDFFLGVLHKKILGVCLQAEGLRGSMKIPCGNDEIKERDERSREGGYDADFVIPNKKGYLSAERRAFIMTFSVMKHAMHFTTEVTAVSDLKQAQVCRGGLSLSQFDKNLECRKVPGLFACGEVLNVDGECGGYNLHFAWASGVLAGRTAVRRCLEK